MLDAQVVHADRAIDIREAQTKLQLGLWFLVQHVDRVIAQNVVEALTGHIISHTVLRVILVAWRTHKLVVHHLCRNFSLVVG